MTKKAQQSNYGGYFQVKNDWNTPISGYVNHKASGAGEQKLPFKDLEVGDTSDPIAFTTRSSSTDHWIYKMVSNDITFTGDKDCGFEREDENGTVTVKFKGTNSDGSIVIDMPHSSDCSSTIT